MNGLTIINKNGILMVDSREVAERTGKQHSHLLRDIKGYKEIIDHNPKMDSDNFFIKSTYKNENNQYYPCYLLTRKGCDMVANKMTGEKGILFTAEYVTEFEEMEQALKNPMLNQSKEIQAIFLLDEKQMKLEKKINDLETNMPLFNIECDELQAAVKRKGLKILGGKDSVAYKDKPLRTKLYSDIQREIKRQFGLNSYKALKRSQLDIALEIVEKYTEPLIIKDEIILLNNQVKFNNAM